MKTKLLLFTLATVLALAFCSCSKKTLVLLRNTSGSSCTISLGGESYVVENNDIITLMYLRGDFSITSSLGQRYDYICPTVPLEFIEKRTLNNRVKMQIGKDFLIYILKPEKENFSTPDHQPTCFPIRPTQNHTGQPMHDEGRRAK